MSKPSMSKKEFEIAWRDAYRLGSWARQIRLSAGEESKNPHGKGDLCSMCAWAAGYYNY